MNVLVTGGAGFIGSNFVRYVNSLRPSWKVTVLDLLTYAGNLENIQDLLESQKVRFVKGDIADEQFIPELFRKEQYDLVVHFAAESHVDRSIHSSVEFVRTNVVGTQVLLASALENKVGKFVHVSTDEVYGSLGPTGRFLETTPLDPSSPYSSSKASSDLLALAYFKTHGLPVIVTRCTNNYGPYQFPEKLIPLFITNALEDKPLPLYGDGLNVRSWLHVDDHCDALVRVAEHGRIGEVYNIGGTEEAELPNIQVTKKILSLLGKPESLITPVKDRLGHDRRYAIDYAKIHQELGWKPQVSFDVGIEQTLNWYINNRTWWERVKSGEYTKYYERHYGSAGLAHVSNS